MFKKIMVSVLVLVMVLGAGVTAAVNVVPDTAVSVSAETEEDFNYQELEDGTIEIVGYYGDDTEITIPSQIDGKRVTSIGDYAFIYGDKLISIIIPDGVTNIGVQAFDQCTQLKNITIPDSVTSIGAGAFFQCTQLKRITIPDGVTSIEAGTFSYCKELRSVNIPDSVTSMGDGVFEGCSYLTRVTIPASVTDIGEYAVGYYLSGTKKGDFKMYCYSGTEGERYAIDNDLEYYILEPGELEPDGYYGNFGYAVLEDGTIKITEYIGYDEKVEIPSEIKGKKVSIIGDNAFLRCDYIKSITIPDVITNIGSFAFFGCNSLTSITIPDSVKSIGYFALSCKNLIDIEISNSVVEFGSSAFYGTPWLDNKRSEDPLVIVNDILIDGEVCEGEVKIPDGVKKIEDSAFRGCKGITAITIPDSVTSIGSSAFFNCESLTSVIIGSGVTNIEESTFSGCSALESIIIPDSVASIGDHAFARCSSLTDIKIPESVSSIGRGAFSSCYALISITIPESVTSIGGAAFYSCEGLTSVTIPSSVETIEEHAFGYYFGFEGIHENTYKSDDFKIYCYKGTAGEKYAIDNGFDYELLEPETAIRGDVNGDDSVDAADITAMVAGLKGRVEYPLSQVDINGDGEFDAADITALVSILKGKG